MFDEGFGFDILNLLRLARMVSAGNAVIVPGSLLRCELAIERIACAIGD